MHSGPGSFLQHCAFPVQGLLDAIHSLTSFPEAGLQKKSQLWIAVAVIEMVLSLPLRRRRLRIACFDWQRDHRVRIDAHELPLLGNDFEVLRADTPSVIAVWEIAAA